MARSLRVRPRKKLEAAAAYWARGGHGDEEARKDLAAFGATPEAIDQMLGRRSDEFEVWPENWDAVQAFLTVQTQWAAGMNGATGLDYTRVRAGLEMAGIACTPQLFGALRLMEGAALTEFSNARKVSERSAKPPMRKKKG